MLFDLKESTKVTRIFDTFFFQKFSQQKIDIWKSQLFQRFKKYLFYCTFSLLLYIIPHKMDIIGYFGIFLFKISFYYSCLWSLGGFLFPLSAMFSEDSLTMKHFYCQNIIILLHWRIFNTIYFKHRLFFKPKWALF